MFDLDIEETRFEKYLLKTKDQNIWEYSDKNQFPI
jgi:hypothetical protein